VAGTGRTTAGYDGMVKKLTAARLTFLAALRKRRGHDATAFQSEIDKASLPPSDLSDILRDHNGRTIYKWTHYLSAYDSELSRFRKGFPLPYDCVRPLKFLEIGVLHGGSLQLWRRYFGPAAELWGIDINPQCVAIDEPGITIRIGSQSDPGFLRSVVAEMGGVDIVIDDGSHNVQHQRASLETLFPLLSKGGIYVVEDTHTSYWRDYGGGYGRQRSFIETAKTVIDDMHAWYHPEGERVPINARDSVPRIVFYDSMVVISKDDRQRPVVVRFGHESY
jgi:hypothetical protein